MNHKQMETEPLDEKTRKTRCKAIMKLIAIKTGIDSEKLLSPARNPAISQARQMAMLAIRLLTDMTLAEIARAFNCTNHNTARHACEATNVRCREDAAVASLFRQIMDEARAEFGIEEDPT